MNTTDDTRPHYGKLPGIHPRAKKKIFIGHKQHLDGEDATMAITTNDPIGVKEAFVDSLPDSMCYDGYLGLNNAFKEWLVEEKKNGFKKK